MMNAYLAEQQERLERVVAALDDEIQQRTAAGRHVPESLLIEREWRARDLCLLREFKAPPEETR